MKYGTIWIGIFQILRLRILNFYFYRNNIDIDDDMQLNYYSFTVTVSSHGRVVKALDLKFNGVSPRRFEPCRLRITFVLWIHMRYEFQWDHVRFYFSELLSCFIQASLYWWLVLCIFLSKHFSIYLDCNIL